MGYLDILPALKDEVIFETKKTHIFSVGLLFCVYVLFVNVIAHVARCTRLLCIQFGTQFSEAFFLLLSFLPALRALQLLQSNNNYFRYAQ